MDNFHDFQYLNKIKLELAGDILPPKYAKLYSQYTRVRMNQPSLKGWKNEEDFAARLNDAVALIDFGLIEREMGGEEWRDLFKRAGELMEWLAHPQLNKNRIPLRLLSAGAYQLAGYPALSLGLLNSEQSELHESEILKALLKADFPRLSELILKYWDEFGGLLDTNDEGESYQLNLESRITYELIKALGIVGAHMRWGDEFRIERALIKLENLSKLFIYGEDSYSWLLSKIIYEVVNRYQKSSLRVYAEDISKNLSKEGIVAFERYIRSNYLNRKSLAWNSQVRGIERLSENRSFALCTPTGSGKTTIAEMAIIQSLFIDFDEVLEIAPIAMYLVPSRALATEVEAKLSKVLRDISSRPVTVTGLYGGIDWGPTDAWITVNERTVLICTYEKAEALIRFLGPLFLNRVRLVVIDEAHSIQFNGDYNSLRQADNRGYRLEMLSNRLLNYGEGKKVIALSAVAESNDSLSKWVSGDIESEAEVVQYRSTRQLIGRLIWSRSGHFEIRYDLLNGHNLSFRDSGNLSEVPYIQQPFAYFPIINNSLPREFRNGGVEKRQRPYLFWAALQLAQSDGDGNQQSVLISINRGISGYAKDFLNVLNTISENHNIPKIFTYPLDTDAVELYEKSLDACEDYFGSESYEYRLLRLGIVVHHGSMPGLMARLFVELIQKRVVHLALATSTLSEGVNLPFETILVPTLQRGRDTISVSEFKNLAGRAGRPGSGTEGRSLVLIEANGGDDYNARTARDNYAALLRNLNSQFNIPQGNIENSPLGTLLNHIRDVWMYLSDTTDIEEFYNWLESTTPCDAPASSTQYELEESLDSLDGYLLSMIVEFESITENVIDRGELEKHLEDLWKKTYANFVMKNSGILGSIYKRRGIALHEVIYPNRTLRRRLYKTSVSPRFGKKVLSGFIKVKEQLVTGEFYGEWSSKERFDYLQKVVECINNLGKFEVSDGTGSGRNHRRWYEILEWWLCPSESLYKPSATQTSDWIKFIKSNFTYKTNWGLGTVIALIQDEVNDGQLKETSIETWPETKLPWIVFWIKELINWGTLDPVAAYLLAHGIEFTRESAEQKAKEYYLHEIGIPPEELLHPNRIRSWSMGLEKKTKTLDQRKSYEIDVILKRDFQSVQKTHWRVMPIFKDTIIQWHDPAGYVLATSNSTNFLSDEVVQEYDFILNSRTSKVHMSKYL